MGEVADGGGFAADLARNPKDFLVGALEEVVENAEFVHELERGGMYCVAAKIAKKIGVFFENENVDAHAGEKETQHHARGAASGDAAAGGECLVHGAVIMPEM